LYFNNLFYFCRMFRRLKFPVLVIGLLVVSFSCKNYQKLLKSADNDTKFETGMDLYEKGDFNKALQFFDLLRAIYRGTEKGALLTYYTANCYYQTKNYTVAGYYYKQYTQMYPRSEHAQECLFLAAYCSYLNSPRPELDQSSTYQALSELQQFIDTYPRSKQVKYANSLMDNLRDKLETKAYKIGKLYYRMGDYQAAITSFENLLDNYPDSDYKEEVLYYITVAYYLYAEKSIFKKKTERYEKTVESYNNLVYFYPESKYLKEVKNINEEARKHLKKK